MGAAQASDTIFSVLARAHDRGDKKSSPEALEERRATVKKNYEEQTDIRYGAARGWWTRSFNRTKHVKSSPSCCNTFPSNAKGTIPYQCRASLTIGCIRSREFVADRTIHRHDVGE